MLSNHYAESQLTANDIVLNSAKAKIGTKVGNGICFQLVDYSLRCADPDWNGRSKTKHIYGKKITKKHLQPGDIVLYRDCVFHNSKRVINHISIVYSVGETSVMVIEQNTKKTLKESVVEVNETIIDKKLLVKGKIEFYRPYSFE